MIDEEGGVVGAEGVGGVEAPRDCGGSNARFVGGADVTDFVSDVEHAGEVEREGAGDGAQMLRFSGELRGRAHKGEEVPNPMGLEKALHIIAGVGGEDAKASRLAAELGESFLHAGNER